MVRQHDTLPTTVIRVAAAVAVLVAVALPTAYFALSYQYQLGMMRSQAEFNAANANRYVALNPEMWRFQRVRLQELLDKEIVHGGLPERRTIFDLKGNPVVASGTTMDKVAIRATAPIHDAGMVVGQFEVARSMRPLLQSTALVAVLGLAIAAAIFAVLKTLPLRALNQALDSLRQSDRLFGIAFHASPDAIIISRIGDGRILRANANFTRLTGHAQPAAIGHTTEEMGLLGIPSVLGGETVAKPGTLLSDFECSLRTKDGETRDVSLSTEVTEINDDLCALTVIRDITEKKAAERRLDRLANYDHLTGLPNRVLFLDRLAQATQRAQRSGRLVALMFLDLDRFKAVNDSLGHPVGDELLCQVSRRLISCLRRTDTVARESSADANVTVARLGGDEFTILVEDIARADAVTVVAQRIMEAFMAAFVLDGREYVVSASVGIALCPSDDNLPEDLMRDADVAMYRAKTLGRNNFQFFTADLNLNAQKRLWLETELRRAVDLEQFELYYQPKLELSGNAVSGAEALLRWRHPERGLVNPVDFISLLEETGLIVAVGRWVLTTACRQAAAWAAAGLPPLHMAVNLSPRQFKDDRLLTNIREALTQSGLAPDLLEVEITESLLMEDSAASAATLAAIKAMGVKIAMDDFGTGYSSLAYLRRFPLDTLKIDRAFVKDAGVDPEDTAIVHGILALAHSLKLSVVAEGVETEGQLALLREALCDQVQGYLISRPLSAEAFSAWIANRRNHGVAIQPG